MITTLAHTHKKVLLVIKYTNLQLFNWHKDMCMYKPQKDEFGCAEIFKKETFYTKKTLWSMEERLKLIKGIIRCAASNSRS